MKPTLIASRLSFRCWLAPIPIAHAIECAKGVEIAGGCGFAELGACRGLPERVQQGAFNRTPTFAETGNSQPNLC
jgi:hypothetical protein